MQNAPRIGQSSVKTKHMKNPAFCAQLPLKNAVRAKQTPQKMQLNLYNTRSRNSVPAQKNVIFLFLCFLLKAHENWKFLSFSTKPPLIICQTSSGLEGLRSSCQQCKSLAAHFFPAKPSPSRRWASERGLQQPYANFNILKESGPPKYSTELV